MGATRALAPHHILPKEMAQVGPEPRFEALRIDRSRKSAKPTKTRLVVAALVVLLVVLTLVAALGRPERVAVVEVREARPGETVTALTATGYVSSEETIDESLRRSPAVSSR